MSVTVRQGALNYRCPTCGVPKGRPCLTKSGLPTTPHAARQNVYLRNAGILLPE